MNDEKSNELRQNLKKMEKDIHDEIGPVLCPECGTEAKFVILTIIRGDEQKCENCVHVFDTAKIFGKSLGTCLKSNFVPTV